MSSNLPNAAEISNVRRLHAGDYDDHALSMAYTRAVIDAHQWERGPEDTARVHDWREHVGTAVAREWHGMNFSSRFAIALDAERMAMAEEWE